MCLRLSNGSASRLPIRSSSIPSPAYHMMGSDSCSFVFSDEAGDDREVALGLFQAIREV